MEERLGLLEGIVEKTRPQDAPSNLAVVGRYILTPRIFEILESTARGAGNEFQLSDAFARLLVEEQVLAYQFAGKRYDCGDKLGYLEATVEYALRHPVLKERFAGYLKGLTAQLNGTRCRAVPADVLRRTEARPADFSYNPAMQFSPVEQFIGNTPLVRLQRLPGETTNVVLAKIEGNNPEGSVKDRAAMSMIQCA